MVVNIHGWVDLSAQYDPITNDDIVLYDLDQIKRRVTETGIDQLGLHLHYCYGELVGEVFNVTGGVKRKNYLKPVFELLRHIGENNKMAYGLIYTFDSDPPTITDDMQNFCVHVLRRGMLEKRVDPFLSPIVPTLADANDLGWE